MASQCIPSQDGEPHIQWIYFLFGDCVYNVRGAASLLLGYLSILCWLNAQLPQVIANYRNGSVASLSLRFLTIWLAGDVANFVGCLLTGQLPFQLYLGTYFVLIDICLLSQWVYYSKLKRTSKPPMYPSNRRPSSPSLFRHPSLYTPLLVDTERGLSDDEFAPHSVSASPSKWYTLSLDRQKTGGLLLAVMLMGTRLPVATLTTTSASLPDATALAIETKDQSLIIGRVFAWACTCLYLTSRVPQIRKNYRRKSVKGLSPSLFVFAVCGNLTYASSILIAPGQTVDALLEAMPYLIGSAGTLAFDTAIFFQFVWYSWRRRNHTLS